MIISENVSVTRKKNNGTSKFKKANEEIVFLQIEKKAKNPEKWRAPTFTVIRKIFSEKQHVSIGQQMRIFRISNIQCISSQTWDKRL